MMLTRIEICLCTHNPRLEILNKVLVSIGSQSAYKDSFSLLVIDNASDPPLDDPIVEPLRQKGISVRVIREPTAGLQFARIAALRSSRHEWVLWIDDDNELCSDFIKKGIDFIEKHPNVGCFGGKLLLPTSIKPRRSVIPFLPYLGIKDNGNSILIEKLDKWTEAEPPGAGAWVHRQVLDAYLKWERGNPVFYQLGRIGQKGLASCDDSLMMRQAYHLDLACAYVPSLWLYHHIDSSRFEFNYLIRLMYGYGKSHILLERILYGVTKTPSKYQNLAKFIWLLLKAFKGGVHQSFAFGIGIVAYHLGVRSEYL